MVNISMTPKISIKKNNLTKNSNKKFQNHHESYQTNNQTKNQKNPNQKNFKQNNPFDKIIEELEKYGEGCQNKSLMDGT